jgi:translation elongation factor EF-1beta
MVSHVMVTDTKRNYGISCRLIPVCFGLRKLSVLDIVVQHVQQGNIHNARRQLSSMEEFTATTPKNFYIYRIFSNLIRTSFCQFLK